MEIVVNTEVAGGGSGSDEQVYLLITIATLIFIFNMFTVFI